MWDIVMGIGGKDNISAGKTVENPYFPYEGNVTMRYGAKRDLIELYCKDKIEYDFSGEYGIE